MSNTEYQNFCKEYVLKTVDQMKAKKSQKLEFEVLVSELMRQLDIEINDKFTIKNRPQLIVAIDDACQQLDLSDRDRHLAVAMMDGALATLRFRLSYREKILKAFLGDNLQDTANVQAIEELRDATIQSLETLLEEADPRNKISGKGRGRVSKRKVSRFEKLFIVAHGLEPATRYTREIREDYISYTTKQFKEGILENVINGLFQMNDISSSQLAGVRPIDDEINFRARIEEEIAKLRNKVAFIAAGRPFSRRHEFGLY